MPSVSGPQHRFFEWIDHTPGAAKKAGVSKSVAHDFVQADKAAGKHFAAATSSKPKRLGDHFG